VDHTSDFNEIEELKQKMAIGRKQATVFLNSKSPAAQTVADRGNNQKNY